MPMRRAQATINLPADLLDVVDAEVRKGNVRSREEFFEAAIVNQVAALHRTSVDQQFAAMAADRVYLNEAVQISEEFSVADWEALQSGEKRS